MTQQLDEQEKKRNQLQDELKRKAEYELFLERVCDSWVTASNLDFFWCCPLPSYAPLASQDRVL